MAGRTRFRITLVALVAAAGLPAGADAAPSGACPARVTTTRDGWRRVASPSFAVGGRGLTSYAVVPDDPGAYFATNGLAVSRTTDGGCTWRSVYTLPASPEPDQPFAQSNATIDEVVAGTDRVYLLVMPQAGPPRVLVAGANGATWTAATIPGLTSRLTRPPRLVADASGDHAYLLVRSSAGLLDGAPGDVLYATSDGGTTWLPRPVSDAATIRDVAVDPLSGADVWVTNGTALLHSTDAGESWELAEETDQDVLGLLSVTHRPGQPVQVVVASARESLVHVRAPGGGELTAINTPSQVTSLAGGRAAAEVAITTSSGTYELDAAKLTWAPAHTADPVLDRLTTDQSATPLLHACACSEGTLWSRAPRHFGGRGPEQPRRDDDDYPGYFGCAPSRREVDPASFAPSAVLPSAQEVVLQPGQSKTVTYRFRVQPRELDLYFLLDGGSRSQLFGCAARQGGVWAAQELARTRNVRVGVGEYRDFLRPRASLYEAMPFCLTEARNDFVYRRKLRLGPIDRAFRESMSRMHVGHCRPGHAALEALRQSVAGLGTDAPPRGRSPYDVRAGQDADFTDGAYKVIVHVAGGYFATPDRNPGYPGAGFGEAVAALVDDDVKQVGIYVAPRKKKHHDDEPITPETGAQDLERVARETGTLARKPVDCSIGRVRSRLNVGEPLTCTFLDDGRATRRTAPPMGQQMVSLVSALTDPRPMGFTVLSGAEAITRGRTPAAPRTLDHLLAHSLTHTVTYRCGAGDAGEVRQVELGGRVGSSVVAKATTVVRCGAPPAQPRLDEFQPPLSLVVPVAAPAAPNLPPNNLAPNTAPQPNSQPQNIAQHLMAGAGVPQEEQQPRLAYANADGPPPAYDELAMSALPERQPYEVPAWLVVQAGVVMTCAAGAMAARRARTAPARVRRQRF